MTRTPETVLGLSLTRDHDSILHAPHEGMPESFSASTAALTIFRLRTTAGAELDVTGSRLIVRTAEDTAVYSLTESPVGDVKQVWGSRIA